MSALFSKDSKVTLHYFPSKGRAEVIRYILTYAKVKYEDHRIAKEDWPNLKATMPLGQMPTVELASVDGNSKILLCQTSTIVRTLATIYGLAGKTIEQTARADEAYESIKEVGDGLVKLMFEKDEEKKGQLAKQLITETVPKILAFLEKRLTEGGGKSLSGGDEVTFADLALAQALLDHWSMIPSFDVAKLETQFPGVIGLVKSINDSPDIKAHIASRPHSEY